MQRLALLVIAMIALAGSNALAQDRREVSVGWRHLFISGSDGEDSLNIPKSWYAEVAVPVSPMFAIVGDVGGHYKSQSETFVEEGIALNGTAKINVHTFLGGVRVNRASDPRFTPFAQVLFGAARASASAEATATIGGTPFSFDFSESETKAAISAGGGVTLNSTPVRIRLHAEWLKILVEDSGNAFRFGAGVVLPF